MCCYKQTQTDWGRGDRSFVCVEEVCARARRGARAPATAVRVVLEHEGGHDRRRGEHRAGRAVRLVAPVVAPGAAGAPRSLDFWLLWSEVGRGTLLPLQDVSFAVLERMRQLEAVLVFPSVLPLVIIYAGRALGV